MLENIKLFATDNNRLSYEDSENYLEPYVSYVEGDNTVHYNKFKAILIATYNVEDASQPTKLYMYITQEEAPFTVLGADMFSKVEVDGTEVPVQDLDAAQGQYQLSAGEHTVKYTLIDPTFIGMDVDEETWSIARLGAMFSQCPNIISVEIPNSVTSIGYGAFYYCSGLASVTVESVSPPTLGDRSFYHTNNCPIYVPNTSVDTYKAASDWSEYASRIQAIPTT